MKQIVVIRNGEVKIRTSAHIHSDGTVWLRTAKGEGPLLDSETKEISKEQMLACAKASEWNKIPASAYARMGTSETGLTVMLADEYDSARRAEQRAYLDQHPEVAERAEISALFARGNGIIQGNREEDDTGRGYNMIGEAEKRLAAWRIKYPEAAKEEARQKLIGDAEKQESLAVGALTYDADGWIGPEEQQKRHDEFMAKVIEIRKQAAAL